MKVLLQGFLHIANFGDVLSAILFYEGCKKAGFDEVDFVQAKKVGICDDCREQIGYFNKKNIFACLKADAFVIISGGSFWNSKKNRRDAIVRYLRFIFPALIFQFKRKPVYILGVGGGPVDTVWLRKKMVRVLNKAKVVTFRDKATKDVFESYGVKNQMTVTADTILSIKKEILPVFEKKEQLEKAANGKKKILLHIPAGPAANKELNEKILNPLIKFLREHDDYFLVLANDDNRVLGEEEISEIEKVHSALRSQNIDFYDYKYNDCWQMCSFINMMDCVVTLKLHVGVVACALEKSVIAFPVHREKTENFYNMISESERCINVKNLDADKAYDLLCRFYEKQVHISQDLKIKAENNLLALNDIIKTVERK